MFEALLHVVDTRSACTHNKENKNAHYDLTNRIRRKYCTNKDGDGGEEEEIEKKFSSRTLLFTRMKNLQLFH